MTEKTPTTCGSDSSTELGLLPIGPHDHPEPRTMMWSALELAAIKEYAARCVAAERERCAQICDRVQAYHAARATELAKTDLQESEFHEDEACGAEDCAEALRMGTAGSRSPTPEVSRPKGRLEIVVRRLYPKRKEGDGTRRFSEGARQP